jgi:hypothetical protein
MFTENEKLELIALRQEVDSNNLPFDKQEAQKSDEGFWCSDWWTTEVCRCLVREKDFLTDLPPEKAWNNPLWKREDILTAVEYKLKMLEVLKENKDFSEELFVCEVGRGIDILLASFVKKWNKIICYDNNLYMLEKLNGYFNNTLPINSFKVNSGDFDFSKIDKKVILLANQCRLGKICTEAIRDNPNILAIIDGDLLKKE